MKEVETLITFYLLSLCITWSFWIPNTKLKKPNPILHFLGGLGPILSASLLTFFQHGGLDSLWSLISQTYRPCSLNLLLLAFALPCISTFFARLVYDPPHCLKKVKEMLKVFIFGFFGSLIIIPFEEIGWRGFALPLLLQIFGLKEGIISLILGLLWSIWHIPLYFFSKPHLLSKPKKQLPLALCSYFFALSSLSFLQHHLIFKTSISNLSIFPAVVAHAALNGSVGAVLGIDSGLFGLWWWPWTAIFCSLMLISISFGIL